MSLIKVETETDIPTGKVRAKVTYADGTTTEFDPVFESHEEAEAVIRAALEQAAEDHANSD